MDTRHDIVRQARTWLGTPYHHQARLKGVGCDCLGLVVGVADDLGLKHESGAFLSSFDQTDYSRQPDGERLTAMLQSVLDEIPKEEAQSGDLALFSIEGNPQHVGLLNEHNLAAKADVLVSLDNLQADLANNQWVSVVVNWFADSANPASFTIKPGVEFNGTGAAVAPDEWAVDVFTRATAHQILTFSDGSPTFGGTPTRRVR